MVFYQKFQELCDSKGVKATNVMKDLQLSTSYPTNWKNGASPSPEHLIAIADYFGVSIDYLLGHEVKENHTSPIEKVDIKPAYSRKRKETVDMLMYRYQNVIDEEYFWLLVDLCAHIKRKDGLDLFTILCNAMIEKGYPAVNYYVEAYKYFVNGEIQPEVWNAGIDTLTNEDKLLIIENITTALSDKFAENYAELIQDQSFIETAKLYKTITPDERKLIVGIIAAYFIGTLHKDTYPIIGR